MVRIPYDAVGMEDDRGSWELELEVVEQLLRTRLGDEMASITGGKKKRRRKRGRGPLDAGLSDVINSEKL